MDESDQLVYLHRDRGDTDSLQKTAIQIVKNGCDMKSRKATRHNQFDDWIALRSRSPSCPPSSVSTSTIMSSSDDRAKIHSNERRKMKKARD